MNPAWLYPLIVAKIIINELDGLRYRVTVVGESNRDCPFSLVFRFFLMYLFKGKKNGIVNLALQKKGNFGVSIRKPYRSNNISA